MSEEQFIRLLEILFSELENDDFNEITNYILNQENEEWAEVINNDIYLFDVINPKDSVDKFWGYFLNKYGN